MLAHKITEKVVASDLWGPLVQLVASKQGWHQHQVRAALVLLQEWDMPRTVLKRLRAADENSRICKLPVLHGKVPGSSEPSPVAAVPIYLPSHPLCKLQCAEAKQQGLPPQSASIFFSPFLIKKKKKNHMLIMQ